MFDWLDWFFELFALALSFFYELVPNYAIAIALLTIAVMIITAPLTLKGTRGMIQMQILQPEMRRLQQKYKGDRQKLNEELMAFYKERNLNPLGGCLPLLLQAPFFFILFHVILGLTHIPEGETGFQPRYLDPGSALYNSLLNSEHMRAFGMDLAESTMRALEIGFLHALPHVLFVALVAVTAYYQQKQIMGRTPGVDVPPQQKMLMRIFPAMFVFFAFVSPGGLVIYFVTSNLCRIGLQAYITRTLYRGEDSLGAQAVKASEEARKLHKEAGERSEALPRLRKQGAPTEGSDDQTDERAGERDATAAAAGGNGRSPGARAPRPASRSAGANRSKKKKRRR